MIASIKSKCSRFELRFRNGQWVAFSYHTFKHEDKFRTLKDGVEKFKSFGYL
jgi:hypothetical protein